MATHSNLTFGLNINLDKIKAKYGYLAPHNIARALGFDASHYDNLCFSGRLALHDLKKTCPQTIFQYATINREILNVPTYEFMIKNSDRLQEAIKFNERHDLDHDWFSANTLIKTYLTRNGYDGPVVETPQQMYMRIAVQLYAHKSLSRVLEVYDDLAAGYYSPASPTIFNAGKAKPQMSSCFLMTIGDNLKSIIFDGVYTAAMIHKSTGAVGKSVSYIRHAEIGREGMSKGLVPLMILYGDTAHYVDQTGKRSGQETDFCRPHHIDIEGFIDICHPVGDRYSRTYDLNTSIWASWLFFKRVRENGNWTLFDPSKVTEINHVYGKEFERRYLEAEKRDLPAKYKKVVKARDLFRQMVQMQRMKGLPYIMNGDAANMKSNHRHMGAIESSNLCVAPETPILTDKGYFRISDLVNQKVNVWNGFEFSSVVPTQTGKNQKIIRVQLSNGLWLRCTEYHKFLVAPGNYSAAKKLDVKNCPRVDAKNLKKGDKLIKFVLPVLAGEPRCDIQYAYTHGLFCADGTYNNGRPVLALYDKKKELLPYLEIKSTSGHEDASGRINTTLPEDMPDKFKVPFAASLANKLQWLSGYLDGDGTVTWQDQLASVQIKSCERTFIYQVQLMLQTMGVQAHVKSVLESGMYSLPDGKGGKK